MKTKFILIICLFMIFAWTKSNAQLTDFNGRQGWGIEYAYFTPAYCNGEMVDFIEGVVEFHIVFLIRNGVIDRMIVQGKGEATGESGEVFKISEWDVWDYSDSENATVTWRCNLRGNQGSHYIGTFTQDLNTGEITVVKAFCPGREHDK